ncbi:MAG: ATP-binding cassette domain-containing protein [Alphaproteobacteria bacterium]|nr:ATP-binding cassette domain-containing protein [Alphaproteobacteria bacterium]
MASLSATNIHKSFGEKKVLRGVDLAVEPGKITCLIGPSGSGKTTLLRAMALVDLPDKGTVKVDETTYNFPLPPEVVEVSPAPWPKVTAVFQSLFLWPHMSLRENILLPATNVNAENAEKDLAGLCKVFEMEEFIDRYPNEASGGQKQRAALARALILNPQYILLDEITSALDIEQTARILTKLGHLKERGIGVLLITHHLGFAKAMADQIVFMADGMVVESGGPPILQNPETERMKAFLHMVEAVG